MPAHPSRPAGSLDADAPVTHYENFPVASLLLPARLRRPVAAIYHFARTADDIADEGDAAPAQRLSALDELERGLHRIADGADPGAPLMRALQRVVTDHGLPLAPFHRLLQAFRQDVLFRPHPDWESLLDYSSRSANPVGHLMLHLYGAATPERIVLADRICTALQLANFWQDVAIDHARGRIYLPVEAMTRHGVTEAHLAEERCDARWQALLGDLVSRTRAMLQSGASLALTLPAGLEPRIGWELRLVVQGGLRILERIETARYDVFRRRPTLGAADWTLLLWRAARMRKPTNEPDH